MPIIDNGESIIDDIHNHITQARSDLEFYRLDYIQTQEFLARLQEQCSQLDAENQCLQRRNSQLENELERVKATLQQATATIGQGTRLSKALEQREVLFREKIKMLRWEAQKAKEHAHESNQLTQESINRSSELRDRLSVCEKKLEKCLDANARLQADLRAKPGCCKQCAGGPSSQEKANLERKIEELYAHLKESERRAQVAEASVQHLQRASARLDQHWQQRLEQMNITAARPPKPCQHYCQHNQNCNQ
ncbi:tropomyosin-like [Drosophila tropicalis]|uniref:tropomyosin-like n=1 Tax=Drosophila tropicalis TaxID=46794 RepID=UPI0035AB74F7